MNLEALNCKYCCLKCLTKELRGNCGCFKIKRENVHVNNNDNKVLLLLMITKEQLQSKYTVYQN